mgnify:CR=1 FL=1
MVKFILWISMCSGTQCANIDQWYDSYKECNTVARDVLLIMQENNVDRFYIACEKKSGV